MRVVHLIDSGGFYGAEVMLLNLCIEQKKQGMNVEVISIGTPNQITKPIEEKLAAQSIAVSPWRMHALPDLRESFKILSHCKQTGTDVIHSHGYKGNILMGMVPKRLRKIPIVSTMHGYTKQKKMGKMALNQWLDKTCLHRLDAVVLVSPTMTHQVPAKRLEKKLHIVPNGIPELPDVSDLSAYISLFSSGDFKIGTLGRLSHEKNFSLLINAISLTLTTIPNAKLVIYGEGAERDMLQNMIKSLGLEAQILLPGYLQNTTGFFADIDVFINCSITEGMPISLLEAMRQGCHIVATDIPANRFLLQDINRINQLCDLTPAALCDSIINFYNASADIKDSLASDYRKLFQKNYTVTQMANRYREIYQNSKPH